MTALAVRNTQSRTWPAHPGAVAAARHWVTDAAARHGATPEVLESVRLAVSEAVTNSVLHAYGDPALVEEPGDLSASSEGSGEVRLTVAVADGEFWVFVADGGRGHQSTPTSPGLGWGLALIAEACKDFMITEPSGGGTELRMGFALGGKPPAGAAFGLRSADRAA